MERKSFASPDGTMSLCSEDSSVRPQPTCTLFSDKLSCQTLRLPLLDVTIILKKVNFMNDW